MLSMYRVAFKYNPRIVTDNSAYPWHIPQDKYALDWKILKEEGYATVDWKFKHMSQWLLMHPKTHIRIDSKTFGKPNGVQLMQLYHNVNTSLYRAEPMNRGQHTRIAGMFPMPQHGGSQSSNIFYPVIAVSLGVVVVWVVVVVVVDLEG